MPKLHRRASDGGYCIRDYIGHFCTYQLTDQGIDFIKELKIQVGEQISRHIVQELKDLGYIYTGGSGFSESVIEHPLPPVQPAKPEETLQLLLRRGRTSWDLYLLFPEIPTEWLSVVPPSEITKRLSSCYYLVAGAERLPALRLWPGKGGCALKVTPQEEDYEVGFEGDWPERTELRNWDPHISGLTPAGTVFGCEDNEGIRLQPGDEIMPGQFYYLLAQFDSEKIRRIPEQIHITSLGRRGDWEVWRLQVPSSGTADVRNWLLRFGHPLAKSTWKAMFISPPPVEFLNDGTPVVEVGQESVIAIVAPQDTDTNGNSASVIVEYEGTALANFEINSLNQQGPAYFAFPIKLEGDYCIKATSVRMAPLVFTAIRAETRTETDELFLCPRPIEVRIKIGSFVTRLVAFSTRPEVQQLVIPPPDVDVWPEVEIFHAFPVTVSWRSGEKQVKDQQCTSAIEEEIAQDLCRCVAEAESFSLQIDAGTFGSLHIRLAEREMSHISLGEEPIDLPNTVRQRARWLARAIPALERRNEVICVPLSKELRQNLQALQDEPNMMYLAQIGAAPRFLVPHLNAISRQISRTRTKTGK